MTLMAENECERYASAAHHLQPEPAVLTMISSRIFDCTFPCTTKLHSNAALISFLSKIIAALPSIKFSGFSMFDSKVAS